ncbi:MAG: caspase family protein [bacterium]
MAKKALMIGINRYRIAGADLRGCVNDVKNMESVLTEVYGFRRKDIARLLDFAATTTAMKAAINTLIKESKRGDVLLLHYSGHGSNVPDKNGDEADHRDEILCPTDLDWKKPLLDDWLRTAIDRVKARGASLTVVMDCCHSGSITRAVQPPDAKVVERYLPSPWDLVAEESGRSLRGAVRGSLRSSPARRAPRDVVAVDIPEILVTGCRSTQTSADADIGGSYNGALTYYLCKAIRAARGRLTNRELHTRTSAALTKSAFDQIPQLEGRASGLDLPFLGGLD